ncbi:MAG: AI-2E family transporter [Clostridia bacterium]|nr:AI-2E family transporter [Clostridia bacterium]
MFKHKETRICATVGISAFLLYLAIHFWPQVATLLGTLFSAALPLILGAGLAYIFALPMDFYRHRFFPKSQKKWVAKLRDPLCLVFSVLSVLAVIALVIGLVVPQLISCVRLILDLVPTAMRSIIAFLDEHHLLSEDVLAILKDVDWKSRIGDLFDVVTNGVTGVVGVVINTVTGVISGIVTGFLSFIFAMYILLRRPQLERQFNRVCRCYLSHRIYTKLAYFISVTNDCFHKYIVGQCVEAVILGVLCAIGMLILRLPYAAMISALIAFTALIPIAGAYIGAAVGAFMILTVSPLKALIFLIFLVILQQLEGNLIYPKVVGSSLGLPGIWVLAAITLGGGIMGILGMFLGVPLFAVLYRILRRNVKNREAVQAAQEAAAAPAKEAPEAETEKPL